MTEIIILGVLTAAWVCGAFFFWRAGAWLPYYLLGAGGATILITLAGRELFPLQDWLHEGVAATVQWTTHVFGISATVPGSPAGALEILRGGSGPESLAAVVAPQPSALVEAAAIVSLVAFYPARTWARRSIRVVAVLAAALAANVLRLLIIVLFGAYIGHDSLEFAELVVGRIVFLITTVAIFWLVISKPTLVAVGARIRANPLQQ